MTVTPEAIKAAEDWKQATHLSKYSPGYLLGLLEAAAPLIAAAERDRIAALASRLGASFPADHPPGAMASFADWLRVTGGTA